MNFYSCIGHHNSNLCSFTSGELFAGRKWLKISKFFERGWLTRRKSKKEVSGESRSFKSNVMCLLLYSTAPSAQI